MTDTSMTTNIITDTLASKVNEYQAWRSNLMQVISDYRDWLAASAQSDAIQELRIYDVLEMLKRDQLVMAFLAEFSRGGVIAAKRGDGLFGPQPGIDRIRVVAKFL